MPEVAFDHKSVPKRPRVVHVPILALPTRPVVADEHPLKATADLITALYEPYDEDGKLRKRPKGAPEVKPKDTLAGPVEVVCVSGLCSSGHGRRQVLLALRTAGLKGTIAHKLGWAASAPKGVSELTPTGPALGKKGTAPKAASEDPPEDPPDNPPDDSPADALPPKDGKKGGRRGRSK